MDRRERSGRPEASGDSITDRAEARRSDHRSERGEAASQVVDQPVVGRSRSLGVGRPRQSLLAGGVFELGDSLAPDQVCDVVWHQLPPVGGSRCAIRSAEASGGGVTGR